MRNFASLLLAIGLAFFLLVLASQFPLGEAPMIVGEAILEQAPETTGAANIVTAVVLGYRGIDTLGEIAILFTSALAAGLVLGRRGDAVVKPAREGVLQISSHLLFPLLLTVGFYIVFHGHLTPGGGFQGGVILAAAFFLPVLARSEQGVSHAGLSLVEGLAGAAFIFIGLLALLEGKAFLEPLLDHGVMGSLLSAGTLPLLYIAVGLKVGAELAGLLANLAQSGEES